MVLVLEMLGLRPFLCNNKFARLRVNWRHEFSS